MDDVDRRIVAALQAEPRATWRTIGQRASVSEATAARRARRLLDQRIVQVIGAPVPTRLGLGSHVLVGFRCSAGEALEVAAELADRPDVRFVAVVTGTFDVVAEFLVQTRRQLAFVLLQELREIRGIVGTSVNTVLRTYKVQETWSSVLLGDGAVATSATRGLEWPYAGRVVDHDSRQLDAVDLDLIQLVSEDGRRSNGELAAAAGISESAVSRRLAALVRDGYVVFAAMVDPSALGFEVEVFVWIDARPNRIESVAAYLEEQPCVRYLSATSGHSDLVCEVVLRSFDELLSFTTQVLGGHDGITRSSVSHQLLTVKRGYLRYPDPFGTRDRRGV
jgi:DNA-binding Lrp family transcriptional regulator